MPPDARQRRVAGHQRGVQHLSEGGVSRVISGEVPSQRPKARQQVRMCVACDWKTLQQLQVSQSAFGIEQSALRIRRSVCATSRSSSAGACTDSPGSKQTTLGGWRAEPVKQYLDQNGCVRKDHRGPRRPRIMETGSGLRTGFAAVAGITTAKARIDFHKGCNS
jgi:hypothetical protein